MKFEFRHPFSPALFFALAPVLAGGLSCVAPHAKATNNALTGYQRQFATASPQVNALLNEGLIYCYAFNHKEAIARFEAAARIEPACAAAWWGIAFATGPHINNPEMTPADVDRAFAALDRAKVNIQNAAPVEAALIRALENRYSRAPGAERAALNRAYAAAMRSVYIQFQNDPDAGELFAESLMNLYPWDLWSPDGTPRDVTPEIISVLDHVLEMRPDHPGANHSYIHTLEASPEPARALAAANRLRNLVPDAGHLVHMPAHIDIRLGHYAEATEANRRAIAADIRYIHQSGRGGFYTVYRAHNYHFLVYAAMFEGRRDDAYKYARELVSELSSDSKIPFPELLDGFLATPYHVMERFGMWDEILAEPELTINLPFTKSFRHFSRAIAFTAKGHLSEARAERDLYNKACEAVPATFVFGNNAASKILNIGREYLDGELEFRSGNIEIGLSHLREAVRRDDELAYDEPWGWMVPPAHALGTLLLEAGRAMEAAEVYEADLKRHPANGWALIGMAECYKKLGEPDRAAEYQEKFNAAWRRADIKIQSSCYCRK